MRTRVASSPRTVGCRVCGTLFQTRHSQGKYCSPSCAREGERASWRKYGERNRSERRSYYSEQYYPANRETVAAKVMAYRETPAGKQAQRVSDERQRERFPEKYAARKAVLAALRGGLLVKLACNRCGGTKAQAHHADYSKPLDVEWLCVKCHTDEHHKTPEGRATEQAAA